MDFSRCVVVNASEYVWERILPYMMKKSERHPWITIKTKNEQEDTPIIVYIWWEGSKDFSATPLRSHMKRVKQKIIKNNTENTKKSFIVSKSTPTRRIIPTLIRSVEAHSMGGSNFTKEL
jgi:hypothetical protein